MTTEQLCLILAVVCFLTGHWIVGIILLIAALG